MLGQIKERLARDERGFTLIELLVVLIILGILMSIALPSYLSFKDRANKTAASANLNALIPDIESYNADNYSGAPSTQDPDFATSNTDSGYDGLTPTILKNVYDGSIVPANYTWDTGWTVPVGETTATNYCIYTRVGNWYAAKHGPNVPITTGKTMTQASCTAS